MTNQKNKNKKPTPPDLKQSALYMWRHNLLKILTFDIGVLKHFHPSLTDAIQSFGLIFIALPCELLSIYFTYKPENFNDVSFNSFAMVLSLGFILSHVIFYLVMSHIAGEMKKWQGFLRYIQMRNLLITTFIVIELLLLMVLRLLGFEEEVFISLTFLLGIYGIFLQWFLIRVSFQTDVFPTIGILLMDNFIYLFVVFGVISITFGKVF